MNTTNLLQRRRMTDWRGVLRKYKVDAGQPGASRTHSSDQVDYKCQGVQGVKQRISLSQSVLK